MATVHGVPLRIGKVWRKGASCPFKLLYSVMWRGAVTVVADCVEFAWPGGGGLGVSVALGTPLAQDVRAHVRDSLCHGCHSVCRASGPSDFFTSCGGGVLLCAYSNTLARASLRVVDSNFTGGSADYGACLQSTGSLKGATCVAPLASVLCRPGRGVRS